MTNRCTTALSAALVAILAGTAAAQFKGPSTGQTSYITPLAPGVVATSLLSVGDSIGGYKMVGIPDGLGAFDNGDGTLTLWMNHELGNTAGVTRAHGSKGAFVSQWTINKSTWEVTSGKDLITNVFNYGGGAWTQGTTAFNRFCSADLPSQSAFYNPDTGLGTMNRIFMNGEEGGVESRAWGTLANGTAYELPHLGKFSWENSVASPVKSNKTVVIGQDDLAGGLIHVYVGTKTNSGNDFDKAGLTNGKAFAVSVSGVAVEDRNTGLGAASKPFSLVGNIDASGLSGAALQTALTGAGATGFQRPEDGAWDPSNPNDYYFVTTDRFDTVKTGQGGQVGRSRLWRMSFTDATQPELGGKIDMVLDGTGPYQMFDNMTIDKYGNILIQEDPGNQAYTAAIWNYNIASGSLTKIAEHDVARFGSLTQGATAPFTQDEESSGIIDASDLLGPGWFLLDVQAHYSLGGELVEGGQLIAFFNPASVPAPASLALVGMGALAMGRRRR